MPKRAASCIARLCPPCGKRCRWGVSGSLCVLLAKFATPRRAAVTIPFMMFDHIGGVNTILHILSSGGTAVLPGDRQPATICRLIEAHRVTVMPTTPTFVNLLLLSDLSDYDLSSLEVWFAALGPITSALVESAIAQAVRKTPPPPPVKKKAEPKVETDV